MPSSRRGTAVNRNDAWNTGAKQNVMPTVVSTSTSLSGGTSSRTPSSSSTSAEPLALDGGPVAVLDDGNAGSGDDDRRHRGDVDGARAVAAGADDVDRRDPPPSWAPRAGTSRRRGPASPRASRPCCATRRRNRRSGPVWRCRRGSRSIAHDVDPASRSCTGDQGGQDVWPGRRAGAAPDDRHGSRPTASTPRASSMTVSARRSGSMGCGSAASARDQVASQASCGRPVSTSTGGAW